MIVNYLTTSIDWVTMLMHVSGNTLSVAIIYPDLASGFDEMSQHKNAIYISKAIGAQHIVGVPKYVLNIWTEFPGFL